MVESWLHTPKVPGSIPGSGNLIFFVISKEMHKSEYLIKFAFPFSSKLISLWLVRTCKLQVLTSQREMTWDMKKLFLWAKLDFSGSLGKRTKPQEKVSLTLMNCYVYITRSTKKYWTVLAFYHPNNIFFKFLWANLYCEKLVDLLRCQFLQKSNTSTNLVPSIKQIIEVSPRLKF